MAPALPPALPPLVRKLARLPQVQRVVLFGSRARGDNASRSDIDLAIDAPTADEHESDWISETVENADTLPPIDLVRLDEASAPMRERIERDQGSPLPARTRTRARPVG